MTTLRRLAQLAAATALAGAFAAPAFAAPITLTATVRDFCSSSQTLPAGCTANQDFDNLGTGSVKNAVMTTLGLDGKPIYNEARIETTASQAVFSGASNFSQWYNDVEGVNKTIALDMTFNQNAAGQYVYSSDSFFPINNDGWGNQNVNLNYHFTLQLSTIFTYKVGQTFNFSGDDDVWVFINGQRVVDLGGIHPKEIAPTVFLDSLNLTAGQDYSFDFFFAERHTTQSNLQITTNIQLKPNDVPEPGTLALLGLALGVAGVASRRRKV
jgi:fibro-slime domain-containing protein